MKAQPKIDTSGSTPSQASSSSTSHEAPAYVSAKRLLGIILLKFLSTILGQAFVEFGIIT